MNGTLASMHDCVSGDHVIVATALLILLASVAFAWKRSSIRRLAVALVIGPVVTIVTTLAASTDHSGTLLRSRYGLPHFHALRNYDPTTTATVDPLVVIWSYALYNLAFWCAFVVFIAIVSSERHSRRAMGRQPA